MASVIGILAGMGPRSTAPFIEKVVSVCQQKYGAHYDIDFPPMMIYSCPTPFYLDRPIDHNAMQQAIISGIEKLAASGVDYIAIPCNFAHSYYEAIQAAVSIPVLHIVEETLRSIPPHCKTVTVLATASTMDSKIYQEGLLRLGKELIFEPRWQKAVNHVLAAVKGGAVDTEVIGLWQALLAEIGQRVSVVIIACTDLNVITDKFHSELLFVDSAGCLAQAVVDRYYARKNHPGVR